MNMTWGQPKMAAGKTGPVPGTVASTTAPVIKTAITHKQIEQATIQPAAPITVDSRWSLMGFAPVLLLAGVAVGVYWFFFRKRRS